MFKFRLQQWGFRKNLRAAESRAIEAQSVAGQTTTLPAVHGRKLGSKRLKSRVLKSNTRPAIDSRRLMVLAPAIEAPDTLLLAENSLRAMLAHGSAELKSWVFPVQAKGKSVTALWSQRTSTAIHGLTERQDVAANFRLLNRSCDEYRIILRERDPLQVWSTFDIILRLLTIGNDLAMSFGRLVAGLCSVYLGRSHPLTLLWTCILRMSAEDMRQLAIPFMDAQTEIVGQGATMSSRYLNSFSVSTATDLWYLDLISLDDIQTRLDQSIERLRQNPEKDSEHVKADIATKYMFKGMMYVESDRFPEAEAALGIYQRGLQDGLQVSKDQLVNFLEINGHLQSRMNNYEAAVSFLKKALETAQEFLKDTNPGRIAFSFMSLDRLYRKIGDTTAAEAVRAEYNEHLKSLTGDSTTEQVLSPEGTEKEKPN